LYSGYNTLELIYNII